MPTPQDDNYLHAVSRALRCGNPDCPCASEPPRLHCPIHPTPDVPTLTVDFDDYLGFTFQCSSDSCDDARIASALAKRGLAPDSWLYTSTGAQEAGLNPLSLMVPHPQDWLWPNRIPMAALTLIAGFPGSGKTAIALDIAARVSVGAPAPDNPNAAFLRAPVLIAPFNRAPASAIPLLRAFRADLSLIYFADTLSPEHLADLPEGQSLPDYEALEHKAKLHDRARSMEDLWQSPMPDEMKRPLKVPDRPPWPGLDLLMRRLHNLIVRGSVALLIVDQVRRPRRPPRRTAPHRPRQAQRTRRAHRRRRYRHRPQSRARAPKGRSLPAPDPLRRRRRLHHCPRQTQPSTCPLPPPPAHRRRPSPHSLLPRIPPNRLAQTQRRRSRNAARSFILHALAGGPKPAARIKQEAEDLGISKHQLALARAFYNVTTVNTRSKDSTGKRWCWTFPPAPPSQETVPLEIPA